MGGFKDHFSAQAATYARFRPRYPAALFDAVCEPVTRRRLAWDCGTGNGQAARALAGRFERVVATDASAAQIERAPALDGVVFRVAPAERSGLDDGTVDLITVAQAAHWFDHDAFHAEVRRVAAPGGWVAVWGYWLPEVCDAVDRVVRHYHTDVVGAHWPPERSLVDGGYRDLPFPFAEVATPPLAMTATWTVAHMLGMLRSWSSTRRALDATGVDPVREVEGALRAGWGEGERPVRWAIFVKRAPVHPG